MNPSWVILLIFILFITLLLVDYVLYSDIKRSKKHSQYSTNRIKIIFFIIANVLIVGVIAEIILMYYRSIGTFMKI